MSPGAHSVRNVARNTGWQAVSKGVGAALSLVYLALVTRSLGPAGFGQFSLALGAAQAVELLIAFQSWQIVVRYGVPHFQAGRSGEFGRVLRFTTWLDIGAALIAVPVVIATIMLLGARFGWTAEFIRQASVCCVVFVISTHWTPIGVLQVQDRFATGAMADMVTPIVRFLGALLVWWTGPSVIRFLAVWVTAELLTAVAYWCFALFTRAFPWPKAAAAEWRNLGGANPGIFNYAVTTNLRSSIDVGGKQVAVVLVGLLLSPAAVGTFRLAQQLGLALAQLSRMVARALFPELMRSRGGAEPTDFNTLLFRTVRITALGGGLVVLAVVFLGKPILGLIAGPQFIAAYPMLVLLGTSAAIEFAAVAFEPTIVAMGRPGLALALRFVSTALLLLGILALAPWLGGWGAGLAMLAAAIVSAVSQGLAVRRLLRRPEPPQSPLELAP